MLDDRTEGIEPITAAHIHFALSTTTGSIVVNLDQDPGCTTVTRELALQIITDPMSYYVNVHNATYPAGALRGQARLRRLIPAPLDQSWTLSGGIEDSWLGPGRGETRVR